MLTLVPLQIHGVWLAIEAAHVQEIVSGDAWVALPGASAEVPGVLAWRGRAIGVLDLGRLVDGLTPLATGETRHRAIIVEAAGCTLALPVHAVREVQEVSPTRLRAAHVTQQAHARGEVEIDDRCMPLIDLGALVERLVLALGPEAELEAVEESR